MKILTEISNGLKQDIKDLELNEKGHDMGLKAGQYYSRIINGEDATQDFGSHLLFQYVPRLYLDSEYLGL